MDPLTWAHLDGRTAMSASWNTANGKWPIRSGRAILVAERWLLKIKHVYFFLEFFSISQNNKIYLLVR